jgi:hypothetical protein
MYSFPQGIITYFCGPDPTTTCIVWSISIRASLPRWVLEFAFQVDISLESGPFGKLNRSNRIRLCGFFKNDLPGVDLKIREQSVWDGP